MYAFVTDGTVQSLGGLPRSARRLDTSEWVLGLRDAPVDLQHVCGWWEVVETPAPAPSGPSMIVESNVELVTGIPTQVWTERLKTQAELDADVTVANRSAIETNLTDDMVAMQAIIDTTNATINAGPAPYMKDVARMLRRLGRQALNEFDGTT